MSEHDQSANVFVVAKRLAEQLESREVEYAFGGALALGYWGAPRGTLDVDLTLFMPAEQPNECVRLLQDLGCELPVAATLQSLGEHGFCSVEFTGLRLDVFLPTIPFYEAARARRKQVELGGQPILVWDAETLAVFKLMFFRRKDLADVEQILRTQGTQFDRSWARRQLAGMYGDGDPRLSAWDELVRDVPEC